MKPAPTLNFELFDLVQRQASALNRRAMVWLVGLLMLVAVSIVLLALFLRTEEAREEDRRRAADTEWLDQTLRFHFRRLESDLSVLALQARRHDLSDSPSLRAGLLWRSPGVVAFHGWIPAGQQAFGDTWPPLQQAAAQHPDNALALTTMLDTTRGLQRAAYAGPLLQPNGKSGQTVWLAAPLFEQGRFLGDYVAAIELDQAIAHAVPAWFLKDHALSVVFSKQARGRRKTHRATSCPSACQVRHGGCRWTS